MNWTRRIVLSLVCASLSQAQGQTSAPVAVPDMPKGGEVFTLDLATALRLAEGRNLDIQLARQRVAEAQANHESSLARFFPWLAPGITYRRHDDLIQDVGGNFIEAHKESYAPGATLTAQVDIGDALYQSLAAKQQVNVTRYASDAQRQASISSAAQGYFDLLVAQAVVKVAEEAVRISSNYLTQIEHAVQAGLAFRGDELRVRVEEENNRLALRRAIERQRLASAQLVQILHLAPAVDLQARENELVPLSLVETNRGFRDLVDDALGTRPELKQSQAAIGVARENRKGAVYGPLIPSAGAQYFAGGLGGDSAVGASRFSDQQDLFAGLSWRIGPGGLFDFSRKRAAEAQLRSAELGADKTRDEIARQVVEAATRVQSLTDQIGSARRALAAAEEGLRLALVRREYAVGVVLEAIQAEQDFTRARGDYLRVIGELNKAQYAMLRALGKM
ncbi:MAG TPA: TolC family protein [Verrucomicrobiae bacterium]